MTVIISSGPAQPLLTAVFRAPRSISPPLTAATKIDEPGTR